MPVKRTSYERFDCGGGQDRTMAEAEGVCPRPRLLGDHETSGKGRPLKLAAVVGGVEQISSQGRSDRHRRKC